MLAAAKLPSPLYGRYRQVPASDCFESAATADKVKLRRHKNKKAEQERLIESKAISPDNE
jgi:hypothetical protein